MIGIGEEDLLEEFLSTHKIGTALPPIQSVTPAEGKSVVPKGGLEPPQA